MKNKPPTSFRVKDINPDVLEKIDEKAKAAGLSRNEFIKRLLTEVSYSTDSEISPKKLGRRLVAIKDLSILALTEVLPYIETFTKNCDTEKEVLAEKLRLICNQGNWDVAHTLLVDSGFEVFDD